MNRDNILTALKRLIQPYVGDDQAFQSMDEQSDLINDLKINSAHIVDIVLDLEDEFNIMVDDESINQMITVGGSIDIVQAKLAGAAV